MWLRSWTLGSSKVLETFAHGDSAKFACRQGQTFDFAVRRIFARDFGRRRPKMPSVNRSTFLRIVVATNRNCIPRLGPIRSRRLIPSWSSSRQTWATIEITARPQERADHHQANFLAPTWTRSFTTTPSFIAWSRGFVAQGGGFTAPTARKSQTDRADQERGDQRPAQYARHDLHGAHERSEQRDLAILPQLR